LVNTSLTMQYPECNTQVWLTKMIFDLYLSIKLHYQADMPHSCIMLSSLSTSIFAAGKFIPCSIQGQIFFKWCI
jgi:hypothetical protein